MNLPEKIWCRTFQTALRIALPILPYRIPPTLSSVQEIAGILSSRNITRVLLVADAGIRRMGLSQNLENSLQNSGITAAVYEQSNPNPTIDNVEQARELYQNAHCEAMIAIGGGSAMDCAKAAGARIARPRLPVSKMGGILKILLPTPLLFAVPTTAGTGSEVTLAAVITDARTKHKVPINDFPLIPDYAVLDAGLTVGLPPSLTASTGLDALTHAVEAYIGHSTSRLTRSMSEEAVTLIVQYLQRAVKDGEDIEARKGMLRAAYCAGISFTRSYVGYIHGIAHSLGGQYGIAHGYANAVILPQVLRIYGSSCERQLARLARISGVCADHLSDEDAAEAFIVWIERRNEEFGIPKGFPQIRREDIPQMAKHCASESNPLYPVPKLMNAGELEQVYYQLMLKED